MARIALLDKLQVFRFHLLDVSYSLSIPPFALNPLAGFSSIVAPELTVEMGEVEEGNAYFKHHHVKQASVAPIVLNQGMGFLDLSFWPWIVASVKGQQGGINEMSGQHRNLLLIQFSSYGVEAFDEVAGAFGMAATAAAGFMPDVGGLLRVPARAWFLMDCVPTRYKPTGDFEATSSDISIAELEIQPRKFEEFSIMG